jgi:hypothetical protein
MAATTILVHHRVHTRTLSIIAAVGFGVIAAFQLAIALGAPFGRASWGGTHVAELPIELRIASGVAVGVYVLAAHVVLARAGVVHSPLSAEALRRGTWVIVGLSAVGSLMNFASPSDWERLLWGPFALVLTVLCFLVARSGPERSSD